MTAETMKNMMHTGALGAPSAIHASIVCAKSIIVSDFDFMNAEPFGSAFFLSFN